MIGMVVDQNPDYIILGEAIDSLVMVLSIAGAVAFIALILGILH